MGYSWTIGQFLSGIVAIAIGFLLVWKADWLLKNFGTIPFAEKYLQTEGGSRLFYKLIGILIIIGGMMSATGLLSPTIEWAVERFFGRLIR